MPDTTDTFLLPYPLPTDPLTAGANDIKALADRLELILPESGTGIAYENDWNAATPYQGGDVVRYNGIEYLAVNPSTGSVPPYSSGPQLIGRGLAANMPATAANGAEYILVDSLTAPTYQWRFRYSTAATGPYKWEFVGGSAVENWVAAEVSTTADGPVALAGGPTLTLPRVGEYEVFGSMRMHVSAAPSMFPQVAIFANGSVVLPEFLVCSPSGANSEYVMVASMSNRLTVAGTMVVEFRYGRAGTAGTAYFDKRMLMVRPVRVA